MCWIHLTSDNFVSQKYIPSTNVYCTRLLLYTRIRLCTNISKWNFSIIPSNCGNKATKNTFNWIRSRKTYYTRFKSKVSKFLHNGLRQVEKFRHISHTWRGDDGASGGGLERYQKYSQHTVELSTTYACKSICRRSNYAFMKRHEQHIVFGNTSWASCAHFIWLWMRGTGSGVPRPVTCSMRSESGFGFNNSDTL